MFGVSRVIRMKSVASWTLLSSVMIMLDTVCVTGDVTMATNVIRPKKCQIQDAVNCASHSQTYMDLPDHQKHTECGNANKTLHCLEGFLNRCRHLAEKNEAFFNQLLSMFHMTRTEFTETCSLACLPLPSSWILMTSLLLGVTALCRLL